MSATRTRLPLETPWLIALVAAAALGCSTPSCARDCDERVAELAADLEATMEVVPPTTSPPPVPGEFEPLEAADGNPPTEQGHGLVLHADGSAAFMWSHLGDPAYLEDGHAFEPGEQPLGTWLEEVIEDMHALLEEEAVRFRPKTKLYVWAHHAVEWDAIEELADAAPFDLDVKVYAVAPRPVRPDREQELLDRTSVAQLVEELDRIEGAEAARFMGEAFDEAIGRCSAVSEVFADSGRQGPGKRATYIAQELAPAIASCRCRIADFDALEYLVLSMLGAFEVPVLALSLDEARAVMK